jgi:hypothetical protein
MYSLLYYLYIEYKQDYKELEERLLQLEKRINDIHLATIKKFIRIDEKIENNTQEGCEDCMPCGRKKGRGGRRK